MVYSYLKYNIYTMKQNNEMKQQLIKYMAALCDYHRPSHKEIAVCNYLLKWFKDLQKKDKRIKIETFQAVKTDKNEGFDIIVDIPATKGYENKPKTMLQSHMDMVWVTREGHNNDKKVEWYIKNNQMKAKYSSLGSDDGTGIAIMQYILKHSKTPHGPLRILLTTDEECDMTGASKLPAKYSKGCKYCFNIDGEVSGEGFIMSAGVGYSKGLLEVKTENKTSKYKNPVYIKLTGAKGGHSGVEISRNVKNIKKDKGGANGLWWINHILLTLLKNKVDYKLGIISHGEVTIDKNEVHTLDNKMNSIPNNGDAVIFLKDKKDLVKVNKIVKDTLSVLHKNHPQEKAVNIQVLKQMPKYFNTLKFINNKDRDRLLKLINGMPQGIFAMSDTPDVAKATSIVVLNFKFNKTKNFIDYTVIATPRAADQKTLDKLKNQVRQSFKNVGMKEQKSNGINFKGKNVFIIGQVAQPWSVNPNSKLCKMTEKAWNKRNAKKYEFKCTHGGLECAYFFKANPQLEIISVGPTIINAHSVDETLHLDTFAPAAQMIIDVLESIAKQ